MTAEFTQKSNLALLGAFASLFGATNPYTKKTYANSSREVAEMSFEDKVSIGQEAVVAYFLTGLVDPIREMNILEIQKLLIDAGIEEAQIRLVQELLQV